MNEKNTIVIDKKIDIAKRFFESKNLNTENVGYVSSKFDVYEAKIVSDFIHCDMFGVKIDENFKIVDWYRGAMLKDDIFYHGARLDEETDEVLELYKRELTDKKEIVTVKYNSEKIFQGATLHKNPRKRLFDKNRYNPKSSPFLNGSSSYSIDKEKNATGIINVYRG